MTEKFDVIVIGGGPGGYVAAIRAAKDRFDRAIRAVELDLKVIARRPPGDARRHRLAWERYARESNEMYRSVWPVAGRAKIVAWAVSRVLSDFPYKRMALAGFSSRPALPAS